MQIFRSVTSVKALPKRQSWHNLSAYTLTHHDQNIWKDLRSKDSFVQATIDRHGKIPTQGEIDWTKWNNSISHTNIVNCLKTFYDNQIELINSVTNEDNLTFVKSNTKGWNLYEDAILSCEKSIEKSETLVSNGARALWVSYNNPPIWKIDTNEWVESDLYWQAYIEKHHFYNPNPTSNDPELPNEIETVKKTWHTKMNAFNDRSDNAILYCYMEHLPSWEYYDIHRRAFLEHMTYYLIRTGGDYQFFPECPPWQWLTDIEELRYRFISITQRRRSHFQLKNLERDRPLDLQPLDHEHDGEEFHLKMILKESKAFEFMVGRLMGNFLFLTHPFIPFQTKSEYQTIMSSDDGEGKIFSIGDDINALFYLPNQHSIEISSPKDGLFNYMDHLTLTGKKLNPGYASLFDIFTDLLMKRGNNWFAASSETQVDAFIRRLKKDDPAYPIYKAYTNDLKDRFTNLKQINDSHEINTKLNEMESLLKIENEVYEQLAFALNPYMNAEQQNQNEIFQELYNSQQLQSLTNAGIISSPSQSEESTEDFNAVIKHFNDYEDEKIQILEYFKSIKLGSLEKSISKQ